jgi:hypothetical protein
MTVQAPDPSARLALEDGRPSQTWYAILVQLVGLFNRLSSSVDSGDTGLDTKAAKEQAWSDSSLIEAAEDKTYRIVVKSAYAWEITEVVTRSTAGTCDLEVSINGTPLGGDPNSVSTSEASEAHSSANEVAVGDDIELTVSSNSGAEGVSVQLNGTRMFD